ncbi:MAG: hypothetical protein KDJ47_14495 [Hyphomicrobiaceae bacterium]|nr:hypothetical protein [Hyphomicrobiaceae bacterium]
MKTVVSAAAAAIVITMTFAAQANAGCMNKAGRGWGFDTQQARFQAWEAVLQDTDWGMWAAWMASGAKVGSAASGYSVKSKREKCRPDGSQQVCVIRAKLCK